MHMVKPGLTLLLLIAVTTLLLGFVYDITREPIRIQQELRQQAIIAELIHGTYEFDEIFFENVPNVTSGIVGYNAAGDRLGFALAATAPGYAAAVDIMVGFNLDGVITGVSIVNHRETPGLGTAIATPAFLNQFAGRTEAMTVTRMPSGPNEIAALTSATISTDAVINGINAALAYITTFIEEN
ncbi:MAG: FMN-binding protein [Turicibacter sp.]|nr:FMN-binding protein [Turicibacter sp.]